MRLAFSHLLGPFMSFQKPVQGKVKKVRTALCIPDAVWVRAIVLPRPTNASSLRLWVILRHA